ETGPVLSAGLQPTDVAISDLNSDGAADLVTANFAFGAVSILPGRGDGTFGSMVDVPVGGCPTALAVADLNGDGKLDVAVVDFCSSVVSVLLGDGGALGERRVAWPSR